MEEKSALTERRRFKRRNPLDGSVAALNDDDYHLVGLIHDISEGGLAFRYIASSETPKKSSLLTIVLTSENFFLEQMPVTVLRDDLFSDEPALSFSLMRKCSVRFGDLSAQQQGDLHLFIEKYTRSPALQKEGVTDDPWNSPFFGE